MESNIRILVCPLNWGLGHASRVVPVIHELIKKEYSVIIAADGNALEFLKNEFPRLKTIRFKSYNINYSKKNSQVFKMALLIPQLVNWTVREHFLLKKIVKDEKIDVVISDNRYGLWNKKTYTVFITHQLNILFPGILSVFEPVTRQIVKLIVKKYDECWVPDYGESFNLSGKLSHLSKKYSNRYFIGPLSRFAFYANNKGIKKYDVLFILSGPEPQRTILENIFIQSVHGKELKVALVRGVNLKFQDIRENRVSFFGMLNTPGLYELIQRSELVICRSGYSSVMDLVSLNKKAVLIPTPGQTEQEYLAKYLSDSGLFFYMKQNEFSVEKAIDKVFPAPLIVNRSSKTDLIQRIDFLEKSLKKKNC